MKRIISLICIVALFTLSLAACGKKGTVTPGTDTGKNETGKKLKIVLVVNGNVGDKSFVDSAVAGINMIKSEYGFETKVVETGYDETKWEPALMDVCDEDWDIIVCGTWQMADYVAKASKEYPDKKFIVYDTSVDYSTGEYKNVYSMEYKQNEGSFLAGAVAAKLSKTGKLGFIGGMDIPVINDFAVGFIQGAQHVNPAVKVATSYIGNFNDSAKGKELAFAQYGLGTDIIFSCASTAGNGAIEAAKEKGNLAVGVDSDQAMIYKEAGDTVSADLIATSVLKRVDMSLKRAIDLEVEGKLPWGTREALGIAEGSIGIAKNEIYDKVVPEDVRKLVDTLEADIRDGKITVNSAFGLSTDELNNIRNAVKP